MQSEFVAMICRMGIFMICAQTIVHFRPKPAYEKYLKLLVSAMMLVQIFLFVGGIFNPGEKPELEEQIQWFTNRLEENNFFTKEDWVVELMGENQQEQRKEIQKIEVNIAPIERVQIGTVQ